VIVIVILIVGVVVDVQTVRDRSGRISPAEISLVGKLRLETGCTVAQLSAGQITADDESPWEGTRSTETRRRVETSHSHEYE
jgi:hypothetical protein